MKYGYKLKSFAIVVFLQKRGHRLKKMICRRRQKIITSRSMNEFVPEKSWDTLIMTHVAFAHTKAAETFINFELL